MTNTIGTGFRENSEYQNSVKYKRIAPRDAKKAAIESKNAFLREIQQINRQEREIKENRRRKQDEANRKVIRQISEDLKEEARRRLSAQERENAKNFLLKYKPDMEDKMAFLDSDLYQERIEAGFERVYLDCDGKKVFFWLKEHSKPKLKIRN